MDAWNKFAEAGSCDVPLQETAAIRINILAIRKELFIIEKIRFEKIYKILIANYCFP